jgi:hypothetical protein
MKFKGFKNSLEEPLIQKDIIIQYGNIIAGNIDKRHAKIPRLIDPPLNTMIHIDLKLIRGKTIGPSFGVIYDNNSLGKDSISLHRSDKL